MMIETAGAAKNETVEAVHVFEAAGLGKAPYRYLGFNVKRGPIRMTDASGLTWEVGAPGQPMSSCDYCGTGIAEEHWLRSADGKRFKVGCDCIGRAGDANLKRQMAPALRKARQAKADARIEAAAAALTPELEAALRAIPHPKIGRLTKLDEVLFLLKHGGRAGKTRAARIIEAAR